MHPRSALATVSLAACLLLPALASAATSYPLRLTHAYPDNVAFPIKAKCPQVVDTKTFLANPSCWADELTQIQAQWTALKAAKASASGTITVESTADKDAATNKVPSGYTQAQVDASVGKPPKNLTLAQARGDVMKAALAQIFGVNPASISVKASEGAAVKSVVVKGLALSDTEPGDTKIVSKLTCGFKSFQKGGQGDKAKAYLFHEGSNSYTTMLPATATAGAKSVKIVFDALAIPDMVTVWTGAPSDSTLTWSGWNGHFGAKLDDAEEMRLLGGGCKFFLPAFASQTGIDCKKTDSFSGMMTDAAKAKGYKNVWASVVAQISPALLTMGTKNGALTTRTGTLAKQEITVAPGKDIYVAVNSPIPGTLFSITPICE